MSYWMDHQKRVRISHVIVFEKFFCQSALQSGVCHCGIKDEIWKKSVKEQTSPNDSVLSCPTHIKIPQTSIATKVLVDRQSQSPVIISAAVTNMPQYEGPKY